MRLTHRARLTLVSAATVAVLLAVVFSGVVFETRAAALRSTRTLLNAALRQAQDETQKHGAAQADLDEIAASDPQLDLAFFDASGQVIRKVGDLPLRTSMRGGRSELPSGEAIVLDWASVGDIRIAAALPWKNQEVAIERLTLLLALLWLPLTGVAGLITWLAVRASFRPLDELTRQAEAMSTTSLNQRLEIPPGDEFAEFSSRLNRFLERLEDSVVRQERFVQDAAHELRTPLAVVRGSIETTLRRPRNDGEYVDALKTVLAEAERLSQLVEVLLQSAAPNSGEATPLDLAEAVERSHARWVDRFMEAGVTLNLEAERARCAIREAEIAVTIDNLLANALRASSPGSECVLSSFTYGSCGRVTVEDEGIGIPEAMAVRIFDRFARGDDGRSRGDGGFGIGLAVCQRLISSRHGTVTYEPRPKGAKFVVELPLVR